MSGQPDRKATRESMRLAADLAAAYVGARLYPVHRVAPLICDLHRMLTRSLPKEKAKPPAVTIEESVTADYLICLEDGRRFKALKRHLMEKYGLTPEQYRKKWGLPDDYPMVAPNLSAVRSRISKELGLRPQPWRRRKGAGDGR